MPEVQVRDAEEENETNLRKKKKVAFVEEVVEFPISPRKRTPELDEHEAQDEKEGVDLVEEPYRQPEDEDDDDIFFAALANPSRNKRGSTRKKKVPEKVKDESAPVPRTSSRKKPQVRQ